jgi:hypothetical protein
LRELIEPGSVFSAIGRQFAPIHHRPLQTAKATVTQIATHSTSDSTNTRINACPWLATKRPWFPIEGMAMVLPQRSRNRQQTRLERDIPAHLLLSAGPEQPSAFSNGNTTQSSTPDLDR